MTALALGAFGIQWLAFRPKLFAERFGLPASPICSHTGGHYFAAPHTSLFRGQIFLWAGSRRFLSQSRGVVIKSIT